MVFSLFVGLGLPFQTPVDAANPAMTIQLPLSTKGSNIIDAIGKPVLLRGVNWFGIETDKHAPHGLWKRDYKEMLAQIKGLGYNIIRLPYSVQSLRASEVSGVDYSIGSNQELYDKSPLEVMDAIIQEAARQQLLILLDSHRLNDQKIPELWYGDGYTEEDWIDTWKMLASRYKNQSNVIGADLKNEPHGRASWGTNDPATDWRLAAERAGNAILSINPNWLIVVEGVENNVPGQKLETHWQGGNLEGVRRYPVRLSRPNKVVYSPHEYGPGVFDHSWFSESSFPKNLSRRWEIGWHYIAKEGIAPVWIGEFGGRQTDKSSKEGIWQRQLVDYIRKNKLGFAYWSWNPNSQDTGGILQEDWSGVETAKQELIQGLLIATNFSPSSIAMPSLPPLPRSQPRPNASLPPLPRSQPRPTTRVTKPIPRPEISSPVSRRAQPQLQVRYDMQSDWQDGFCANMQVTNQGNSSVRDWQLKFRMNQAAINNSWNGNFRTQGSQYVVTPLDWGRVIEPGQTRELGFCANKLGSDYRPGQVSVTTIDSNSSSQKGSPVATKAESLSKAGGSQLKLTSDMHSNWQEGFCLSMQLSNTGNSSVRDWRVKFQMEQAAINNTWNGNFQSLGSQYTVTPPDWGKVIEPGQSRELGFCANKLGTNYQPKRLQVEG
ncbi:MAG: cellulase family glycosylhydrolase [Coleofasciculaceae cyanobacterium]